MPTIQVEIPQDDYEYLNRLSEDLGTTPDQLLLGLLGSTKTDLTNEQVMQAAQASLDGPGENIPVDEAFWRRLDDNVASYIAESKRKLAATR